MLQRVFLGWDEPFVGLVADWLLSQQAPLEECMVLVPTSQSARQLKLQMARRAGALLSPKFSTPGVWMRSGEHSTTAPDWLESLAWQEVLEHQTPIETFESLFSSRGHAEGEWAGGLASEMVALRRSLQDRALNLRDVARRLSSSPEGARWEALAAIEGKVETWIRKQGYQSRSQSLKDGLELPACHQIVLAGITELPPLIEELIRDSGIATRALIAAPQSMEDHFSEIGTPLESWSEQSLSWPDNQGSVEVTTDPRSQAHRARLLAAKAGTAAQQLALGSGDTETGDFLAEAFSRAGWPTHHPASTLPTHGLRHWLSSWANWLNQPDLTAVMDLLSLPESSALIETDAAPIAHSLARLKDRWMVIHPDDLRHQLNLGTQRSLKADAVDVIRACEKLERWRKHSLSEKPAQALRHLLGALQMDGPEIELMRQWIDEAAEQMDRSKRSTVFWIQLMLSDLASPESVPPDDRVLDVHGWLELLFHPGSHLILCGLNEGKVPATSGEDPWLGESGREMLGLNTNKRRSARDAFLLESMIQSRIQSGGRVDLLCTRSNEQGESQLPSRLLLATRPEEIASRVELLFRELEPVDAKLRWEAEAKAKWVTPTGEKPQTLNATSFRDYLACPFRYFLKHVLNMQPTEPDRIEWNARDFGNVIHHVLESWGTDLEARQLREADEISHWLNQQLDLQVQSTFNERIPLAVRIQLDSMRQRLAWFSEQQAQLVSEGWQVIEVEHKFEIPLGTTSVRAKIDRIDRHQESGELRIIDYKTGGQGNSVSSAHRTRQNANSSLPAHIGEDDPALYQRDDGKKELTYLWKDLQLPLYALAIQSRDKQLATPCYFKLGETRKAVALETWQDFDEQDLEAALACAQWVSERIADGKFTPIAEKPRYDDYEILWCSRQPQDVMAAPMD